MRAVAVQPSANRSGALVVPVAVLSVAAGAAVVAPLATYTVTLAAFGLAHVLSELRYVDLRFGARIGRRLRVAMGLLLAAVVVVRVAAISGVLVGPLRAGVELGLVAALAAVVLPRLGRGPAGVVAGLVVLMLLAGAAVAPYHALLGLAVLHNLTPLGFLAERLEGPDRGPGLALAAIALLGVPLVIATGAPVALLAWASSGWDPLAVGPLSRHLQAFLHPDFHGAAWAPHVFAAAVYGQCAHYYATIVVLPGLVGDRADGSVLVWPSRRGMAVGIALLAVPTFAAFALGDFGEVRALYGVVAAVHAWVEVPLLLLALKR